MPGIPQLFYSYQSTTGHIDESERAIKTDDTCTYSIVFDKQRNSIWSRKQEFGIPRIETDRGINADYIRDNGIPILTYSGATTYFYVNNYGAISIFETCKILSFDSYNREGNISTNSNILPGPVSGNDLFDRLEWTVNGTYITSISARIYVGNTTLCQTGNLGASATSYDVPDTGVSHNGIDGQVVYGELTVTDYLGSTDTKTIVIVKFKSVMYYKVSASDPNGISGMTRREIVSEYEDTIPETNNNEYFWLYVPNNYSVVMEQGGGVADLLSGSSLYSNTANQTFYDTTTQITYKKYRTPRTNVGGAQYKLKLTKLD